MVTGPKVLASGSDDAFGRVVVGDEVAEEAVDRSDRCWMSSNVDVGVPHPGIGVVRSG